MQQVETYAEDVSQFKLGDITTEEGEAQAIAKGEGFEFWWIRCSLCEQSFGQVIHKDERYTWCVHCDVRLVCSPEERSRLRNIRLLRRAPN